MCGYKLLKAHSGFKRWNFRCVYLRTRSGFGVHKGRFAAGRTIGIRKFVSALFLESRGQRLPMIEVDALAQARRDDEGGEHAILS